MAVKRFTFIKSRLDALPVPEHGRARYYDTKTRALVFVIRSSGARSFFVYRRVEGKPEEIYLGPYPDLSIENARRLAEEKNGEIALGENPNDKKRERRAELTLGELFEMYLEQHAKAHKKSWKVVDQAHYDRFLKERFEARKLSSITRSDVRAMHADVGKDNGKVAANRLVANFRKILNFGIADGHFKGPNPVDGITMFPEQSRDRRLHADELPAFFAAVEQETNAEVRDFVLMCLWTGARKSNVLAMRWEELNLDRGEWMIPMTKNGTPQALPLVPEAIAILGERKKTVAGPWVFPADSASGHLVEPARGWRRICKAAGIKGLTMHDLRRTLGSWEVDTGATLAVVGKTLNHKSHVSTAIYARLSMDPVRAAMTKATEAMMAASKPKKKDKAAADDGGTPAPAGRFRLVNGRIARLVRSQRRPNRGADL